MTVYGDACKCCLLVFTGSCIFGFISVNAGKRADGTAHNLSGSGISLKVLRGLFAPVLGGATAWFSLVRFGGWDGRLYALTPQALLVFCTQALLFMIAITDIKTKKIPNVLNALCGAAAVGAVLLFPKVSWTERLAGLFAVSLPMFLLTIVLPDAFGGGDIKLMAALGAFLGWKQCMTAFIMAVFLGGSYAMLLLLSGNGKRCRQFAFGPFICMGAAAAIFCAARVWR